MDLGARWSIENQQQGIAVKYENYEQGLVFDCGVSPKTTPLNMILEFIVAEGDPGDFVFLDGNFYIQLQKEVRA